MQLCADSALEQARKADTALAQDDVKGPLHGFPMTIKDNLDTAGVISSGGTQGRADYVPEQDAAVVARLRAACGCPPITAVPPPFVPRRAAWPEPATSCPLWAPWNRSRR